MKYAVAAAVLALAALAVPGVLDAHKRSAQKRTTADMRSIATAWEARATDRNSYVVVRPGRVSYDEMRRALEPTYIKHLPRTDGWGNPFQFTSSEQDYTIRALGSDHRVDATFIPGPTTDFARDLVYANGSFLAYPEES